MRKLLACFAAVTTAFTHATTGKSITAAVGLIWGLLTYNSNYIFQEFEFYCHCTYNISLLGTRETM